jgi:hypothetical protein
MLTMSLRGVFYMSMSSNQSGYNLTHQQSDVLDYITEIAQELAQMAERAGCGALGRDLRQALLTAQGVGEKSPNEGIVSSNGLDDERRQERL